jgi:hypothetical protein
LPNALEGEPRATLVRADYAALGLGNATLTITDDTGSIELIRLSSIESISLEKRPAA